MPPGFFHHAEPSTRTGTPPHPIRTPSPPSPPPPPPASTPVSITVTRRTTVLINDVFMPGRGRGRPPRPFPGPVPGPSPAIPEDVSMFGGTHGRSRPDTPAPIGTPTPPSFRTVPRPSTMPGGPGRPPRPFPPPIPGPSPVTPHPPMMPGGPGVAPTPTPPPIPSPSPAHPAAERIANAVNFLNISRPDKAVAELSWAVRAAPGNDDTWILLGNAYMRLDDAATAVKAYEKAALIDPENPEAHLGLGNAHFAAGNRDLARLHYTLYDRLIGNHRTNSFVADRLTELQV